MPLIPAALVAAFFVPAALVCLPHDEMERTLSRDHGETLTAWGAENRGGLLQVFVNPETGSWTMVIVAPNGTACAVGMGESWQDEEGWPA